MTRQLVEFDYGPPSKQVVKKGEVIKWLVIPDQSFEPNFSGGFTQTFYNPCAIVLTEDQVFMAIRIEHLRARS